MSPSYLLNSKPSNEMDQTKSQTVVYLNTSASQKDNLAGEDSMPSLPAISFNQARGSKGGEPSSNTKEESHDNIFGHEIEVHSSSLDPADQTQD